MVIKLDQNLKKKLSKTFFLEGDVSNYIILTRNGWRNVSDVLRKSLNEDIKY